ncbi:response regulator [Singulisphaera sp. PoT]|uniref:response regulator n=1 Tax=Singulisphaera sp. PoT TaxID=3411797 RepID=UPI003BF5843E
MGTALIVEDHPDQAEMVARLLRLHDYEPVVAMTGNSALEMVRSLSPDVVVLDLMLPDINGFDVCRLLRSDRSTMMTPVVMLTALGDDATRTQGFRVGANAYVTKPYGIQDLFNAIDSARAWRANLEEGDMQGEIHVELNSEVNLLQDLNDFLMTLWRFTPFEDNRVLQLRQAVMEIAQNAIEWGNRHESDRLVNITYRIYEDKVEIIVRDQGNGFDLNNLPHAAGADDPFSHLDVRDKLGLRSGGYGLMICKGMVDEMRYNDAGNEVTLIKRFTAGAAQ